jgi:hypothetical protein
MTAGFTGRLAAMLEQAALVTRLDPRLRDLAAPVEQARARSAEPMRVAVVGSIKAGKSTLVNALLGEQVVATGTLELTFNVNELYWSPVQTLTVNYLDGSARVQPFAELTALTTRDPERLAELRRIRSIRVGLPNPLLQTFRLIDTPGLNSVYEQDEQNTLRALGLSRDEVEASSAAQVEKADALAFLFSRSLAADGAALVSQLQGPVRQSATPLKAIGVLSRCDQHWMSATDAPAAELALRDPLVDGRRVCARLLGLPQVSRLFYALFPVCGLLASGAVTLVEEDFATLRALANIEPARLATYLGDVGIFTTSEDGDLPVSPPARERVTSLLSAYGVWVAVARLRAGAGEHEVRQSLVERSGVLQLRALLLAHFGNRSTVIKADGILRDLDTAVTDTRKEGTTGGVDDLADLLQRFRTGEHAFAEVDVLAAYYRRELGLRPEEAQEILAVTGEHGTSAPARLRAPAGTSIVDLIRTCGERSVYWRGRAGSPVEIGSRLRAMRTIARSYQVILDEIHEAADFLGIPKE